jgi:hypothetical protein
LALTAEYARGSHSYDHALFGIRFYFGKNKPLIDRHRQDDPPSLTQRILTGIGLYGAEFNRRAEGYFASSGASWDGGSFGATLTSDLGEPGLPDLSHLVFVQDPTPRIVLPPIESPTSLEAVEYSPPRSELGGGSRSGGNPGGRRPISPRP